VTDLFLDDGDVVEETHAPAGHRSRVAGLVVLIALVVLMAAAAIGAFVLSGDADRAPDSEPPPSLEREAGL
jgi:flagellar basal body-associated protein FliL